MKTRFENAIRYCGIFLCSTWSLFANAGLPAQTTKIFNDALGSVAGATNAASLVNVTLQAENMPIKTSGAARPPGWALWEDGYLAQTVNFSSSGLQRFTLRAVGVFAGGEWSQAELRIDQSAEAVIDVNASVYTDFTVEFDVVAGDHEVAIAFINDLYNPPNDRNLYIDWLQIQSVSSDTQAPVISNVTANGLTTSSATIVWTTDEASDSQIEYGLTTSYGTSTALSATLVTNHTAALTNLQANTTYHYRVKSKDAAGNLAMSGDFIFTTASVTLITVLSPNGGEWWIGGANQQITWNALSSIANVKLEFSRNAGGAWRTIVASTPNIGVYNWPAPDTVSNTCLIRVSDAANASVADVSNQTFFVTLNALVNFTPSPSAPVLNPGATGSWDENIRERGWFMLENGVYHMWYGGWQGQYNRSVPQLVKLGYASSTDGVNWTKHAGNPIQSQHWTEDIVVVKDGNTYFLYAEDEYTGDGGGALIDLYTSTDKINWTRYGTVMGPNGNGWEQSDVGTPTVWKEGNTWYMLYEGLQNGSAGKVGLATSSDGKNWIRYANNPVLSHPFNASLDIAIDSIIKINGVYYAYGHYDAGGLNWVGGMFTSTNLIAWTAYPNNPIGPNSPVIVNAGANYYMYGLAASGVGPYYRRASTSANDATPPILSAVAANNVTASAATVVWTTDEASDSQVEYGLTASYGLSSTLNTALVTVHSATLTGLQANTTYHYRVKSKDAAGNLATSNDFTFTTLPGDVTPPVISSVSATNVTTSAATISWNTNEASDTQVEYGLTTSYGSSSTLNTALVTVHSATLTGLQANTTYHYRVKSKDTAGNLATSNDFTFTTLPADVTPPVISSVSATNVTTSAATISWNTNEASDTQVEYGLTTSYGSSSTLNTALVTVHSATLTGLQANTTYHYRVKSKDAAGNLATSNDFTFTTLSGDVTPPVISSVSATNVTTSAATISWNTNEASDTQVEYGLTTSYGVSTSLDLTLLAAHAVALTSLQANTVYHYRVKSKDAAGNLAMSADFTFATLVSPSLDVTLQAESMPIKTNGDVRTPGWVLFEDGYIAENVNFPGSGTFEFTLRAFGKLVDGEWSQAEIRIDQVAKATITVNNSSYTDFLTSFAVNAGTHQVAVAFINDIYEPPLDRNLYVDWLRVKSTIPADTQPPIISSVSTANVTTSSATINWSTNEASDTQVEYGLTTSYGSSSTLNTAMVTAHSVALTSLQANTTYHYRAKSRDAAGNLATSSDFTFTTTADVTPPVISSVAATSVTVSSATISWNTNEASDTQVEYGLTTSYGASTTLSAALLTSHTVTLTGLQTSTLYHYRVKSKDAAGNLATSSDFTFTTIADVTAPVISSVAATNVTISSATISWSTNEASDTQVEYGVTTSYGASSTLNTALLTAHSETLTSLQANTTYHYRAKSKDLAGNLATSADFTFTTSTLANFDTTLQAEDMPIKTNGDVRTPGWVLFEDGYLGQNVNFTGNGLHQFTLRAAGKLADAEWSRAEIRIDQVAKATITVNNLSYTDFSVSFAVNAGMHEVAVAFINDIYEPPLDRNLYVDWLRIKLSIPADTQPPVISSVAATNVTISSATIGWSTNEASDTQVEYGLTTSYGTSTPLNATLLTNHTVALTSLQPNATYHYRVKSKDAAGNLATSSDFTFTTTADVTPPVISSIAATNVTNSSVTISWSTNEISDTQVEYGLTASYGTSTPLSAALLTNHTVTLTSLQANTTYHYRVKSKDATGNLATSADFTFTTNAIVDMTPPVISSVAATNVTGASATIGWSTNEASDTQVEYGLTTSYGASTSPDLTLLITHAVTLTGLQSNTMYHYRVKSKDAAGNLAMSGDFALTTAVSALGNVAFANVQDLFSENCIRCHQGITAPAGLVLLPGQAHGNIVNAPSTEYPQWQRVQPGSRATSWLYEKISKPTPPIGSKMGSLSAEEIELIGTWIDQGANTVPIPPYKNLEFRATTIGNAEVNIAYFFSVVVWGGLPPYQFEVTSGELPSGLILDASSGMIVGTPNTSGSYDFTLRVNDNQTPAATLEQSYRIEVFNTHEHWQLPPGFMIEKVVSDLHLPVNIAFVPNPGSNPTDPYFYVTLLYGDIIMVQRNFQRQAYVSGLLNFAPTGIFPGSGEIGVTGIAVDPVSGDVFASMVYEELPGSEDFRCKVVRFHSTDGGRTAATQVTILSDFPAGVSHQIQELTIGADGKLYVNTGDGWTSEASPDRNDLRGKILRMNLDGSVPEDNPFPDNIVYATGFRNPFGAAWRQADGKLYVTDNGQETDDRIAKIVAGEDYGWGPLSQDLTKGAIYLWNPTVAPVAMDFLQNNSFPANYYGNLFVGLSGPPYIFRTTPRGKKIQRFVLDPNGQVVSDSVFLDYIGGGAETVIGVAFGDDGLYFTDLYGENGFDEFGQTHGNIYRIRSTAPADTTRPVISNVQTTNITGTSATIVWQTNEAATQQVDYGLTTSYGVSTALDLTLRTAHSIRLTQLAPQATYHFRVLSADVTNNSSVSGDFTFTTTAVDATPPLISAVQVDSITVTGAVVKWTTNEPSSSFVDFGLTTTYGATFSNAAFVTSHRVALKGLADSTVYHFRVRSLDASDNAASSSDSQFTTRHQHSASLDLTLEAENMPIKTNGDARPPGWALFENGYIAENVTFSAAGVYLFTLEARGNEAAAEWSMAELWIDQAPQATLTIDNEDYTDFTASFTVPAGTHEVAIAFINDIDDPPLNRNLYVDWLRIQNSGAGKRLVKAGAVISTPAALPERFVLQNYPNPFNAATKIRFTLPRTAEVDVNIFDVAGRELSELVNGEHAAGNYEVIWNGRGRNGQELSSGVYLVRLRYRSERSGPWSQLLQRVLLMR